MGVMTLLYCIDKYESIQHTGFCYEIGIFPFVLTVQIPTPLTCFIALLWSGCLNGESGKGWCMDKKAEAKAIPIEELYSITGFELAPVAGHLKGRCPFHPDNTNPNFVIYPDTNSWYCFRGCGGGDSIAFYMKYHKVDFKNALKEMLR